jgi:hypothetical protein
MLPREAIESDPPNVWLTSLWGYDPKTWGFIGFSKRHQLESFLEDTKPGVLVVIYINTNGHEPRLRQSVVGVMQLSHQTGPAAEFMDPVAYIAKQQKAEEADKWDYAVRCERAWQILPEQRPRIETFADISWRPEKGMHIGAQGVQLKGSEARKLLDLSMVEVDVYGASSIIGAAPGTLADVQQEFSPSRGIPSPSAPFTVRESEGPKELYILRLEGSAANFLGRTTAEVGGKAIVKVGFSQSAAMRCLQLQAALPAGAFRWRVIRSNTLDGTLSYSSSRVAMRGEDEMKRCLAMVGESLGREFFLADEAALEQAWTAADAKARGDS